MERLRSGTQHRCSRTRAAARARRAAPARTALMLAALVIASAADVRAADRVARGASVVVREGPASYHPGIAVLQRNERVRFLGERDGWSEVGLSDGRRGWVPSAEIVAVTEAAGPTPAAAPGSGGEQRASEVGSGEIAALHAEIASLQAQQRAALDGLQSELREARETLDRLAVSAAATRASGAGDPRWPNAELVVTGGAALVVGLVLGAALQRRRARRERSLRF